MKTAFISFILLIVVTCVKSQSLELPFFENFENEYQNWMFFSNNGADQWHISGDDGIDGSKCARFYITSIPPQANDDWLVSNKINTQNIANIAINFKFFYHGNGSSPEFYYSDNFDGNPNNSNWTMLDNSFWKNEWSWNDARLEIAIEQDSFVFAVRYINTVDNNNYVLLDNFSVLEYEPINVAKVGISKYFEFYSDAEDSIYWDSISNQVDNWYEELSSYWDRPGLLPLFDPESKTSIYLLSEAEFESQSEIEIQDWKCGYIQNSNTIITKLPIGEMSLYDNSYSNLVKNLLGQFILTKQFGNNVEDYFKEAFGLFYTGYQPKRDSILKAISIVGETPSVDVLQDITNLSTSYKKCLITSFVESKVLSVGGVQNCYGGGMTEHWHSHLKYYYNKPENERIKLLKQTERFNIYASDSELPYLNDVGNKLEERLRLYESLFDFPIKHRLYCVVYPSAQARTDCLIFSDGYGGSGWSGDKLDIATNNLSDPDVYSFLIPHELFHVFHFNIVEHLFTIPALYSEGLANYISLYEGDNYLDGNEYGKYKIEYAFNHYVSNYNIEPGFEQILDSQADENYEGYYNDPYYLGELFYKYFFEEEGDFSDLRIFFLNGLDYTKIGKNYDDIDQGFITFLKEYANLIPSNELVEIPFEEPFNGFINGWGKPGYCNIDNWLIDDGGMDGTNCAKFYTHSDKNIPIESWLISPPIEAAKFDEIYLSFDFGRYGQNIELELFYTNRFEEYVDSTSWTSIKSLDMPINWDWNNTGNIKVSNPPDTIYIGIKMSSTGELHQQFFIDNFKLDGNITGITQIAENDAELKIYPNPVTTHSHIHFTLKESGKAELAIFDLRGKKLLDISNQTFTAGHQTFPIGKYLTKKGIYLCRLKTKNNISTLKLIVE